VEYGVPIKREGIMTCNMGKGDRTIRGILGIIALAAGLYFRSWWGLVGVILLGTALAGICPAYIPFGINTGKKTDAT